MNKNYDLDKSKKWAWMMDYCKKNRMPPAQEWAWTIAKKEYEKAHEN